MPYPKAPGQNDDGDHQSRQEEPQAIGAGGGRARLRIFCRRPAAPKTEGGGERHDQDEHAVAEVAEMITGEEGQGEEPPEEGVAAPARIGGVAQAHDREAGEDEAGQGVDLGEADHGRGPLRPKRRIRAPWTMKAAMAVGIAQTDR